MSQHVLMYLCFQTFILQSPEVITTDGSEILTDVQLLLIFIF